MKTVVTLGNVYKKYKNSKHPAYLRISKEVKSEIKKSKLQFEQKLAENIKEDKKSFAYVKGKTKITYLILGLCSVTTIHYWITLRTLQTNSTDTLPQYLQRRIK